MDEKIQKLDRLASIQELQNRQVLGDRVEKLEETVESLLAMVSELQQQLSTLQMENYRDHTRLGQNSIYTEKE